MRVTSSSRSSAGKIRMAISCPLPSERTSSRRPLSDSARPRRVSAPARRGRSKPVRQTQRQTITPHWPGAVALSTPPLSGFLVRKNFTVFATEAYGFSTSGIGDSGVALMLAARTSRSALRLRASSATLSGRADVAPRMLIRSRFRSLSSRKGGTFRCSPAATLAQYPRGGTGIRWRPQTFASPRSDIPNSCASAVIGLLQTRS